MSIIKYAERMVLMNELILHRSTGDTIAFSKKLGISKRQLLLDLSDLRLMGMHIKYSRDSQSYYFSDELGFGKLFRKHLNKGALQK
ncbi:MAG: hypothetical protein AB7S69_04465 [Salinivirgaceae bacterium]|jgi:predicted DNA-binding transcriptional regulator YafY